MGFAIWLELPLHQFQKNWLSSHQEPDFVFFFLHVWTFSLCYPCSKRPYFTLYLETVEMNLKAKYPILLQFRSFKEQLAHETHLGCFKGPNSKTLTVNLLELLDFHSFCFFHKEIIYKCLKHHYWNWQRKIWLKNVQ